MARQDQKAGDNSVVIQSGGAVNIGVSADDLKTMLSTVVQTSIEASRPMFAAMAREEYELRVHDFEKKVYERLSKMPEQSMRALKTPGFQYVLAKANQSYGTTGESYVRDTLVDLIAQRATQKGQTRLALTMNDAINKVASLTKEDFSTLSFIYLLTRTRVHSIRSLADFIERVVGRLQPFAVDIAKNNVTYEYLAYNGCGIISALETDFASFLTINYPNILTHGFSDEAWKSLVPEQWQNVVAEKALLRCWCNIGNASFSVASREELEKVLRGTGVPDDVADRLWSLSSTGAWSEDDLLKHVPILRGMADVWHNSRMRQFEISPLGIALGHANATRVTSLKADLSIWIN